MNVKRVVGIVAVVVGIGLYAFAGYIAEKVSEGKEEIAAGQKKVNAIRDVGGGNQYTKGISGMVASSGQKKIDMGKEQAAKYEKIAGTLHISGIVVGLIGAGLIGISFIHKKK